MILKMELDAGVRFVNAATSGNGAIVGRLRRFQNIANDLNVHIRTALSQHCLVGRNSFGAKVFAGSFVLRAISLPRAGNDNERRRIRVVR